MQKIIYFTRFSPTTQLGGGARRTLQILHAIQPLQPEVISSSSVGVPANSHSISDGAGKIKFWSPSDLGSLMDMEKYCCSNSNWEKNPLEKIPVKLETRRWHPHQRKKIKRLRDISVEWAFRIKTEQLRLAFMDDPVYFEPLLKKLRKCRIPVVAVSHNLESMAPHQHIGKFQDHQLKKELSLLKQCRLVISISREETWLLNNFGINAMFFPYFPVDQIAKRLQRIRNHREKSEKKDFLLVGSAMNQATARGMSDVIRQWGRDKIHLQGDNLLVGGYQSDTVLQASKRQTGIEFLGELQDADLDRIMTGVMGTIVYQKNGSGALTRIAEMLLAGIPVLVNSHASRSYYNTKGLVEFDQLDRLKHIIKDSHLISGDVSSPPKPDESILLSLIKQNVLSFQ